MSNTTPAPDSSERVSSGLRPVHRAVRVASSLRRRQAVLARVLLAGAVVAGAMLVLVLVARLVPQLGLPPGHAAWPWIAVAALAIVAVAGVMKAFTPSQPLADAIAVDDRLALRDRLSSALALEREATPFALAAVRDGEAVASDARLGERIRRAFAVKWPGWWWAAPVLALAAFVSAWLLPQLDPWSSRGEATPEELRLAQDAIDREVSTVVKAIEESPLLSEELASELKSLDIDASLDDAKPLEQTRREALRKLTELSERLDEMLQDENAMTLEALQDQLSGMPLPKSPEALKFAEALKRGDFSQAKKALESLQKDIEAGKLTEEQKQALADALEKMAEQLAKSESDRKAVEEALQQAGLDPQLASNPDALKQALENSQRLTESQRQALQKAAQCQQGAAEMRKQLAQQMAQMASQCKGGQQGQAGQCGQGLGSMLSDLEMQQAMLMQAQAAANACKGGKSGLCAGMGSSEKGGVNHGQTNSGGIGGGWRPEMPNATKTKIEQAKGQDVNADVIAREFIEGAPTVGTSEAVLRRLDSYATSSAVEGNDDDPGRPDLDPVIKHYFGQMEAQVRARRAAAAAAAGGESNAKPPAPAKP